jgi:hypothetical protein
MRWGEARECRECRPADECEGERNQRFHSRAGWTGWTDQDREISTDAAASVVRPDEVCTLGWVPGRRALPATRVRGLEGDVTVGAHAEDERSGHCAGAEWNQESEDHGNRLLPAHAVRAQV